MSNPNQKHPYTGRPNTDYLTLVVEKVGNHTEGVPEDLFASMRDGTVSTSIPGFRVTGIAIGDEFSEQDAKEEEQQEW